MRVTGFLQKPPDGILAKFILLYVHQVSIENCVIYTKLDTIITLKYLKFQI